MTYIKKTTGFLRVTNIEVVGMDEQEISALHLQMRFLVWERVFWLAVVYVSLLSAVFFLGLAIVVLVSGRSSVAAWISLSMGFAGCMVLCPAFSRDLKRVEGDIVDLRREYPVLFP